MPLGEQPRRLSHVESTRVFALLTTHMGTNPDDGQDVESGHVRLLDDQTFERCDSYSLQPQETALSILTLAFDGEGADATFVAVGLPLNPSPHPTPTPTPTVTPTPTPTLTLTLTLTPTLTLTLTLPAGADRCVLGLGRPGPWTEHRRDDGG